ncbi:MAG: hypothetical protein V8R91_00855 [Butyricimonas faecihominis]
MIENRNWELRKEEYTIPLREFFDKGMTREVACRIGRLRALRRGYYRTDGRDKCGFVE